MSLALLTAKCSIRFVALQRAVAYSQTMPVHRTMPGKRVLPIVAANSTATTLKGLGGFRPAYDSPRRKVKRSSAAASLATQDRLTTKQFSAG
jgi:hypothetical protein